MSTPSKEALEAAGALDNYRGTTTRNDRAAIIDSHFEPLRQRAEKAEARVAELVAALRETLDDPNSTISGALYYRMEQVLARAESGVPDHIRDAAQMVSPDKHPDTELIDRFEEMCGSLEYCDADEEQNHWRAYGYAGSNEGVGRTMRDALRAAIAARMEVQP